MFLAYKRATVKSNMPEKFESFPHEITRDTEPIEFQDSTETAPERIPKWQVGGFEDCDGSVSDQPIRFSPEDLGAPRDDGKQEVNPEYRAPDGELEGADHRD